MTSRPDLPHDLTPLGEPVGREVPDWTPRPRPPRTPMDGRFCAVVPLDAEAHARDLYEANRQDRDGRMWTYLGTGPYDDFEPFRDWAKRAEASADPLFFTVVDKATGKAVGTCSYLRIDPTSGVIEVGWITWSPLLQRAPAATEAMYLVMARVFDELGYRRYEWKCNALNAPSMRAAERLGFSYEGLFRQATIVKGRNRDTAWFSILDGEWPRAKAAFQAWLAAENFDAEGRQRRGLAAIRAGL